MKVILLIAIALMSQGCMSLAYMSGDPVKIARAKERRDKMIEFIAAEHGGSINRTVVVNNIVINTVPTPTINFNQVINP